MKQNKQELKAHPEYALQYWKLKAFFEDDKTIQISDINDKEKSCTITVEDPLKGMILERVIKPTDLKVNIKYKDILFSEDMIDYLCKDNPHYDHLEVAEDEGVTFIKANMFKADVMHYYSDDMFSPTGHTAILPYQIAKMIFKGDLNFQTQLDK